VFGWFDSVTGEGHVEAYGMPTYESQDIVAAQKPERQVSFPFLTNRCRIRAYRRSMPQLYVGRPLILGRRNHDFGFYSIAARPKPSQ